VTKSARTRFSASSDSFVSHPEKWRWQLEKDPQRSNDKAVVVVITALVSLFALSLLSFLFQ
jgi:hypothetical protein